jgi:hypothetical protein
MWGVMHGKRNFLLGGHAANTLNNMLNFRSGCIHLLVASPPFLDQQTAESLKK